MNRRDRTEVWDRTSPRANGGLAQIYLKHGWGRLKLDRECPPEIQNFPRTRYPEYKPGEFKKMVGAKIPPNSVGAECNESPSKLLRWSGGNQFIPIQIPISTSRPGCLITLHRTNNFAIDAVTFRCTLFWPPPMSFVSILLMNGTWVSPVPQQIVTLLPSLTLFSHFISKYPYVPYAGPTIHTVFRALN